jgi:hypothetical protein
MLLRAVAGHESGPASLVGVAAFRLKSKFKAKERPAYKERRALRRPTNVEEEARVTDHGSQVTNPANGTSCLNRSPAIHLRARTCNKSRSRQVRE